MCLYKIVGRILSTKNKEKLVKRYQYLSEEEKNKKHQLGCKSYKKTL